MTPPTSESTPPLGGRLPLADPPSFTPAQRELYDQLVDSWVVFTDKLGIRSMTDDGRLIGPFNAFFLHPELTMKLLEFQAGEAANTGLSTTVREVVIIVLGAVYRSDYELYAHKIVARAVGLTDDQFAALSTGEIPESLGEHEKLAARVTHAMATHHRIDAQLYQEAESAFGAKGLFDIAAVMGIYHTVCTMLNLFEVPAP